MSDDALDKKGVKKHIYRFSLISLVVGLVMFAVFAVVTWKLTGGNEIVPDATKQQCYEMMLSI